MKTVQAIIENDAHTELKVIAAKEVKTLQSLVGEIITQWLESRKGNDNGPEENDKED